MLYCSVSTSIRRIDTGNPNASDDVRAKLLMTAGNLTFGNASNSTLNSVVGSARLFTMLSGTVKPTVVLIGFTRRTTVSPDATRWKASA